MVVDMKLDVQTSECYCDLIFFLKFRSIKFGFGYRCWTLFGSSLHGFRILVKGEWSSVEEDVPSGASKLGIYKCCPSTFKDSGEYILLQDIRNHCAVDDENSIVLRTMLEFL
jgi:hypothetical protein